MKITLVIEEWRQSTKGGRSTLMRQMAIELSRLENVEVCILIPSASLEDKEDAQRYNIKVFEPKKFPGFEPVDCLQYHPQGFSTDIIIGYGIKPGCHGQILKNNLGCKWVHVVLRNARETVLFQTADSAISKGKRQHETEIELCKNADMVLTVGSKLNETFNSALHQCKKDDIFKLIPGIFNETFGVQKQSRDSKTFEILVFGRGNTEDFDHIGLHVAVKAVTQLNKCEPFYILKVVGAPEGEQEKLAERLGEFGISRNHLIVRSFNKERTNLAQLFSEVDLVLMPSGTGAFGLTALEALSAGVPILINHDSGLAEALEEVTFGHACIVDQEPDWVVQIKRAREHRKTRLEEAGMLRDMYEEKYCWQDQCAAFVKRLRALLSGHAEEMQQEFQGRRRSARKRVAGHAEEMQQESQGKRNSAQKRVAGHAEQMQQESQGKRSSAQKRVAGHAEEMQQKSQGKRSSARKRVAGHAEEMQQKSQGKRSSAKKRVAGHAEEIQQESQGKRHSPRKRVAGHAEEIQQESQGKRHSPQKRVAGHAEEMQQESQVSTVQHLDLFADAEVIARSVIFRGEVTEKGNVWNLPEAAAYVTFHEGALPKPLLFTCSVWPPKLRSPPISSDELLVSNVIELSHDGPPDLKLSGDDEGNVTVALLHSASDLKGYEVIIKQLVDLHDNVWKDLGTRHASSAGYMSFMMIVEKPEVSDWSQLVEATCTPSRFSSFAAVWRLKSFTFTSGTLVAPQFKCVVPDFPDIHVEVPFGSVPADQDFTLTIKVQEFPSNEVEDIGILCGPVIHISSSQNIEHMEPVTIKVPIALRESKHDLSELSNEVIRISYLDSEGKQWRDITGQLEGPVAVKDGIVEFKVKHFSRFCPVCMFTESVALLQDFFRRLFFRSMPQCVHFLACLSNTPCPDTYSLLLYCYPNFKKADVEKKLLGYDIPYQGEGKSKEPACVGDGIVVSPIALDFVRESQRNEKVVLRFLGNDISDNSDMALHVRLDSKSAPTVKFSKGEEQQKLLCEVSILKTRPASVVLVTEGRGQRVVPEERPALVTPGDVELECLASKLGGAWKKLGRRLKIQESELDNLDKLNEDLSEKGFKMLRHWKEVNGSAATYQILGDALQDDLVNRRDLAEEFCFKKQ